MFLIRNEWTITKWPERTVDFYKSTFSSSYHVICYTLIILVWLPKEVPWGEGPSLQFLPPTFQGWLVIGNREPKKFLHENRITKSTVTFDSVNGSTDKTRCNHYNFLTGRGGHRVSGTRLVLTVPGIVLFESTGK